MENVSVSSITGFHVGISVTQIFISSLDFNLVEALYLLNVYVNKIFKRYTFLNAYFCNRLL